VQIISLGRSVVSQLSASRQTEFCFRRLKLPEAGGGRLSYCKLLLSAMNRNARKAHARSGGWAKANEGLANIRNEIRMYQDPCEQAELQQVSELSGFSLQGVSGFVVISSLPGEYG